jgi:tellurite resistance protein
MFQVSAVVGGLIGGAVGAFVWAAVVYFTEYEIGWIAWGVGGLVGYGVAAGNRDGTRSSTAAGVLAVAISIVAILAGKWAGVQMIMPSDEEILEMATAGFDQEEYVVSYVADDVAAELEAAGRTVDWPSGVDPATASAEADYPPEIWAEAELRWAGLTEQQKLVFQEDLETEVRDNVEANLPEIRAAMAGGGFAGSFSPMDVVFFGLAMVTAFGVGSGARKTQEQIAEEYAQAVQLAMIRVMLADGAVDPEEVRRIAEVYHELTGAEVSVDVIQAKATLALSGGRDLSAALTELAPHLSDEGKATVLKSAVTIAIADGRLEATERAVLDEIAGALGMSESQMRETVAELTRVGV